VGLRGVARQRPRSDRRPRTGARDPRPYVNDLPVLADGGYEGAGHGVLVPVKTPKGGGELDPDTRTYNKLLRTLRCLGERGFALLVTRWKTLQRVTISQRRITGLACAALVLTQFEHKMITQ
jgi:hypothetical protein